MATIDRLQGYDIGVAVKPACYVASTANIALSSTQTIDGLPVGSSQRVLVKDQTDTVENGIYHASSGAWLRARDFDGVRDAIPGTLVYVDRGVTNGNKMWVFNSSSTAETIDVGTTQITIVQALV